MWADVATVDRAAALRCNRCGLRQLACACQCIAASSLPFAISLILHPNEFKRPTSTSRFLSMYPQVLIQAYERKAMYGGDRKPLLLFPVDETTPASLRVSASMTANERAVGAAKIENQGLVVLDGTWKECSKMVRQNRFLQQLERVEVITEQDSCYPFRKNQIDGGLSTAEAIAELTCMLYNVDAMKIDLMHFFKHALASQNGHRITC